MPLGQLKVSRLEEMSSFQGLFYTLFYVAGTMHCVLIQGDVLISGVSLWRGSTAYTACIGQTFFTMCLERFVKLTLRGHAREEQVSKTSQFK